MRLATAIADWWQSGGSYASPVEWIPARIRLLREAGLYLSQDQFATALGFAKRTIGNAERGTHPPSLALRRALDHALEEASDAQRDRFLTAMGRGHAATQVIPASQDRRLYPVSILDGLRGAVLTAQADSEVTINAYSVATTMADTAQVHRLYQLANYDAAARLLPAVLIRLQDRYVAAAAYIAAAKLATKLGDSGLAWVTADRAITAAHECEHPALVGAAIYQVACALLLKGNLINAEQIADAGVDKLASTIGTYRSSHRREELLSVQGSLFLLLAVMAARRDDSKKAQAALSIAGQLAEDLGYDGNWTWTAFGATNVAIHQLSVRTRLGDTRGAMRLAETIDTDGLPSVLRGRRSQVHLELTWVASKQGADALAVLHLLQAERVAEQSVSRNASAAELLSSLLGRERLGATPGLRGLAQRAGLIQ